VYKALDYGESITSASSSRSSKRLVSLALDTQIDSGFRVIVTYSEWCKACNIKQVHTWEQLCKQFPCMRNTTANVHLAVARLLNSSNIWYWFEDNFFISSDTVGYYTSTRAFGRRHLASLSDEDYLSTWVMDKYLTSERKTENRELKELATDASLNFVSVPNYLINKRKFGAEKAKKMLRKRKASISLPVLNLPLFDAAGVSPV